MDLSEILNVITVTAVILGIVFGLVQLRHYHLSREREATLLLLNSFQTANFFQGIWAVQDLPARLNKQDVEERAAENLKAVLHVMWTRESIGILVFNHEVSIDIVNSAYSWSILISWHKLEKYVAEIRDELQRERSYEWFQWLAERMIDREAGQPTIPAYLAFRDWQ